MFPLVVVVAVISISAGSDFEGSDCKVQICFTWKLVDESLILTCKVNAKQFAVTFWDPKDKERGFCIPGPFNATCTSLLPGATIKNNESIHETYFIITKNVGRQYNGNWKCSYGYKNEEANVDVIILGPVLQTISRLSCLQSMMFWAFLGFCITFFLVHFLLLCIRKFSIFDKLSSCVSDIKGKTEKKLLKVTFIAAGLLLFCIPLVVGLTENGNCKAEFGFTVLGIAVGIYAVVFLHIKGGFYTDNQDTHTSCRTEDDSEVE